MTIKEKYDAAVKALREVTERAKSEGRPLTRSEAAFVDGKLDEAEALKADLDIAAEQRSRFDKLAALDPGRAAETLEGLSGVKYALTHAVATKSSRAVTIERKALGTTGLSLPAAGETVVGSVPGTAAVALRDLFPNVQVDVPTVRWYRVGAAAGGPDVVPELGLKPELANTVTPKDSTLVKLAAQFAISTEMQDDAPFVVEQILREALLAMLRRENSLVTDTLAGASGIITATTTKAAALDGIASAIATQEAVNGLAPEAIIINPVDLAAIRATKASGSGDYLAADPLAVGGLPSIWNIPVLSTAAATAGTAWLARRDAGVFYFRDGVTVTAGHNGDDLIHNRITTIVEQRVLPVLTQPGLVTRLTITA